MTISFNHSFIVCEVFNFSRLETIVEVALDRLRLQHLGIHLTLVDGLFPINPSFFLFLLYHLYNLVEVLLACTLPLASGPFFSDERSGVITCLHSLYSEAFLYELGMAFAILFE